MTPEIVLGLRISLAGLVVTFTSLGLLILVIRLLILFFPADRPVTDKSLDEVQLSTNEMDEQRREETAAALAVSVALLQERENGPGLDPSLGKLLEQ